MKRSLLLFLPFAASTVLAACQDGSGFSPVQASNDQRTSSRISARVLPVCTGPHQGFMQCDAWYHADMRSDAPTGWGATDLEAAYNLTSSSMGSGQTVAIVDAFDNPNAASDLATYRTQYGLPAVPSFQKYNQKGQQSRYPPASSSWGLEEDIDIQMVSAGCPNCNIMLVEANSNSDSDLGTAEDEAVKLGATIISNSYGGTGVSQSNYDHPGVTILAAAGDGGYGIQDPADFPSVVSVGGTVLTQGGSGRGWSEVVWPRTASGCGNSSDAKPKWQKAAETPSCAYRVANDVSAVALAVAAYDSYGYGGWVEVDGTSIASPLNAAVFGLAGNSTKQDGGKTFWEPKHHRFLNDVTSGSNGTCSPSYLCTAGPGYDGPSGWGTPNGSGAY